MPCGAPFAAVSSPSSFRDGANISRVVEKKRSRRLLRELANTGLIALGILLIAAPGVLRLSSDVGLILGVASIAGGAAMLVSRMRDRSEHDGDDGAVV